MNHQRWNLQATNPLQQGICQSSSETLRMLQTAPSGTAHTMTSPRLKRKNLPRNSNTRQHLLLNKTLPGTYCHMQTFSSLRLKRYLQSNLSTVHLSFRRCMSPKGSRHKRQPQWKWTLSLLNTQCTSSTLFRFGSIQANTSCILPPLCLRKMHRRHKRSILLNRWLLRICRLDMRCIRKHHVPTKTFRFGNLHNHCQFHIVQMYKSCSCGTLCKRRSGKGERERVKKGEKGRSKIISCVILVWQG